MLVFSDVGLRRGQVTHDLIGKSRVLKDFPDLRSLGVILDEKPRDEILRVFAQIRQSLAAVRFLLDAVKQLQSVFPFERVLPAQHFVNEHSQTSFVAQLGVFLLI